LSNFVEIREALTEETESLSHLAFRSKGYWGYSQDFMAACRSELAVDASRIGTEGYLCFVAQGDDTIIG
jgi:hypothetical protein